MTLRITPEFCGAPDVANPRFVIPAIKEYVNKYGDIINYAWSYETKNKFGEDTHPHYHINFTADVTDFNKQSFQAWFRRQPLLPKGNKCYSFTVNGDPEDEDRWWRYLFKEQTPFKPGLIDTCYIMSLPKEFYDDIKTHVALAVDERKLQIKRNIEARDRALANDSFRLRCYSAVQTALLGNGDVTSQKIYVEIVKYYQDNNKIPPFNTLMNMVIDYKLHTGIITAAQHFQLRYNTDN